MERKTLFLLFLLAVVTMLSIHAGNKYNVDPSDYEAPTTSVEETPTEEAEEQPVEEAPVEEVPAEVAEVEEIPVEGLAITFESDYVYVEQGSECDLRAGVTLHDDNDTQEELYENLSVYGNPIFDINEPGVYEITYVVENSAGETATAVRTFEVLPAGSDIPVS